MSSGPQLNPAKADVAPANTAEKRTASSAAAGPTTAAASSYSAPPSVSIEEKRPPTKGVSRGWIIGLAAAACVGAAIWFSTGAPSAPPAPPVVAAAAESQREFSVALVDADLAATELLNSILAGTAANADDLNCANGASLAQLTKSSPKMAEQLRNGERTLYRVYLLDFQAQDGDQVELLVDGIGLGAVDLSNAGQALLIPLIRGTPAQMKLVALADGGGGVTVGLVSSLGEARTSVLQVGQFEQWQVNSP